MVSSSLNPLDQQFLNHLNRVADRMERAQRQVSTGVRMAHVSDDPDQVPALLSARANLSAIEQIQVNLGRVQAEVDAAEQALQSAVQLLDRARTLATQAATGFMDAQGRQSIAVEVGGILEQLVGLAATQIEGRFIFSGDADGLTPYTIDLAQATPISAYLGAATTRRAQHPNGSTFAISHTAQEIFDSATPGDNIFASLLNLRDALLANDEQGIFDAVQELRQPAAHLNRELAFYGTTQRKIAEARQFAEELVLQLRGQISRMEDADLTESILELNQHQTQQEAALRSRAQMPRATLFDYLG